MSICQDISPLNLGDPEQLLVSSSEGRTAPLDEDNLV